MEEIILNVELREKTGRANTKDVREQGFIPAVVYAAGKDSQSLKIPRKEFLQLLHQYHLENMVINLKVNDAKAGKPRACLIKEIQYHPVGGEIVHLDFNEISLTKVIKVNVPVEAKGESVGVKQEGGSLEHILWEVEVECLPTQIPKNIEVDVSALKVGDSIHIRDLVLPIGIKVLNDPGNIVLSCAAPMKEEVPVEAQEGEEKQEPEVIKEKKEVPAEAQEEEKKAEKEKK